MAVTEIEITRSVAALVAEADEEIERDRLNEGASVERWEELLRAQLEEQFPGAAVRIRTVRAPRAGLDVAVRAGSAEEERSAREAVMRIAKDLGESGDWVVPEVGG
jgi:hypothetical protein